jgi:GTP-binding protein
VTADYDIRKLFFVSPQFLLGVTTLKDLPSIGLPEIAFAGRSNVGKSSLINALFNRSDVARISNTPGRTQQLNFFQLQDFLILVDLPGYGYAQASKKIVDAWNNLLRAYLKGRPTLKRVYILIDSRHGLKENDLEMMEMLDKAAVSYQLVLTKIDQRSRVPLSSIYEGISRDLAKRPAAHPELLVTSSRTKQGIEDVQKAIYTLAFNKEITNDGL